MRHPRMAARTIAALGCIPNVSATMAAVQAREEELGT